MQKTYKRDWNNGKFSKKNVLSSRYEMNNFIFRWMFRGLITIFIYAGGISIVNEVNLWWGGVIDHQKGLKEKAEYIAWQHIPIAEASEPLPYVPYVPDIVPKSIADEFVKYAEKYNVPKDKMARIMQAESSFNPNAKNVNKDKTVDRGYCQQNDYHWEKKIEKAGLVYGSLQACFWIYSVAGDAPWYASKNKWAY